MDGRIGYQCDVIGQKEVVVNLSEKCNNLCLNCPNDDNFRNTHITREDVEEFVLANVSEKTQRVTFIGGEPTICPFLFKIMNLANRISPNAVLQINSNGRMFFYEKFSQKLLKYPRHLLDIHIALYGSNSKIHDNITQINGSFHQTLKGIHNLISQGITVNLRIIVSKQNFEDLENFGKLLHSEFGPYRSMFNKIVIVGMDLAGNALKNKDILAVSHIDIAPHIEKCIDVLNQANFEVEVHLLPKGIFKKEYQKYALMSGCVGGDFIDSANCNICDYHGNCARLLRSYAKIFGDDEHEPVLLKKTL